MGSGHKSAMSYIIKNGGIFNVIDMQKQDESNILNSLVKQTLEYNRAVEKLKFIIIGNTCYSCTFRFGNGNCCGLTANKKFYTIFDSQTEEIENLMGGKTYLGCTYDFTIGSCVTPDELIKLVFRKLNYGNAETILNGNKYLEGKINKARGLKLQTIAV
jgi:hypothetical protein